MISPFDKDMLCAGSSLFWLALVTSILVVVAMNMDGGNIFNP